MGGQLNDDSSAAHLSSNGRYLLFTSKASNLVPDDTNGMADVFVRDQRTSRVERVSVTSSDVQGKYDSNGAAISADGRYVLFDSYSELTANDKPPSYRWYDVYLRDRVKGTTTLITTGASGTPDSGRADAMTDDARYVMYYDADTMYRLDRRTGKTTMSPEGLDKDNGCRALSADGRYASCGGMNYDETDNVWIVDFSTQEIVPINIPAVTAHPTWNVASSNISADGRYLPIVFGRTVNTNQSYGRDLYLYDRVKQSARLLLTVPPGRNIYSATISPDAQSIAFSTDAALVSTDKDKAFDLYEWSVSGGVKRISTPVVDNGQRKLSTEASYSPDSRTLVFTSLAGDLVRNDTNRHSDIFETESRR